MKEGQALDLALQFRDFPAGIHCMPPVRPNPSICKLFWALYNLFLSQRKAASSGLARQFSQRFRSVSQRETTLTLFLDEAISIKRIDPRRLRNSTMQFQSCVPSATHTFDGFVWF